MSYRLLSGVQSTPRVMRGASVRRSFMLDVPLFARDLGADIEMPAECARTGEVMYTDGTCAPPSPPKASPSTTMKRRFRFVTPAFFAKSGAGAGAGAGMSRTTIALAAVGAIGLIYYLSQRK